jgi:peptidoglycan/LPS O-acetylase OafA/YrhL
MVVFLTIVLAASIALYHALERPAQRWINSWSFKV